MGYSVENKIQKIEIALITFEKLQDGKKIEICVPNEDYERLAEGDVVNLTIKGIVTLMSAMLLRWIK